MLRANTGTLAGHACRISYNNICYRQRGLTSSASCSDSDLPLKGIRVLELGQLIAGPFAGQLLGQFGAEVIKIEPPSTGDPLRVWRELDVDGTSPWWRSIGKNKKSVAIDLRKDEGRDLIRKLAIKSDVLLENFKPGTHSKNGRSDPRTSTYITRVSGYGQTGPWAQRPGYASVCEAESGFRFINGYPDEEKGGEGLAGAPVRPNISLGDSVAAFLTVLALLSRQRQVYSGLSPPKGKTVDVSIVESMLSLMEGIIPEYDRKGKIRGPSGSSVTGIVPTNAYPCLPSNMSSASSPKLLPSQEYEYVVIGGNGDSIYTRLMHAIARPDLVGPNYARNQHRVARQHEIEKAISEWTKRRTVEEVVRVMMQAGVPVGRVNSVKEVLGNKQVVARGAVREVKIGSKGKEEEGWNVKMQGTFPVIDGVDPQPVWAGPDLGAHTDLVLSEELELTRGEIERLRKDGVIG